MTTTVLPPRPPRATPAPAAALVAVLVAAVVALLRLGRVPAYRVAWGDLDTWLATATPADAAVALLRPVALTLTGYLLAVTLLYLAALLCRAPAAIRRLGAVTPAVIRRVADRAVAASLVAATLTPAAATARSPAPGAPPPGVRVPTVVRTTPASEVPSLPTSPAPVADVPAPVVARPRELATSPTADSAATVVVRPGDHLWAIAGRHLADARRVAVAALDPAEHAAYWATVVAANRPYLTSGDPDLIHPREEIRLPPTP